MVISFFYVNVGSLIADDEVINVESTVSCGTEAYDNSVDFY